MLEHRVDVDAVAGEQVQLADRNPPPAPAVAGDDLGVQRGQCDHRVGRVRGPASIGPAEQRVPVVAPAHGRATGTRLALVTGHGLLRPEVGAPRLL